MTDLSRRRFLQAVGAGATAATLSPWLSLEEANAGPLAPGEKILVSLFLGGGLDGAHMFVPASAALHGHYRDRRGPLGVDLADTLSTGGENAIHGVMPALHARYVAGDVACVRGVDLLGSSGFDALSHFDKTDHVMMGRNAPAGPPSGVWARWADAEPDNGLLLGTVGFGLPILFGGGQKRQAISMPRTLDSALGAKNELLDNMLISALQDLDAARPVSDPSFEAKFGRTGTSATQLARDLSAVYPPDGVGESELMRNMRVIGSLIEANVTGTRVYGTVHGSYDTHENQLGDLEQQLLPDLDASLDAFFGMLTNPDDVVVMVWTEFGRRPEANRTGTDHGTAGNVVLIGSRVNGGLYGTQPSFALADLDVNGNLQGSMSFNRVYAEVISRHLGGNATAVLGASHAPLGILP